MKVIVHLFIYGFIFVLAACSGNPAPAVSESEAAPGPTATPLAEATATETAATPAAQGAEASPAAIVVSDRSGRELQFEQPPARVVCYYNSCYGMMATLGVMPVAQAVNPEMLSDSIYFEGQGSSIKTLKSDGDGIDIEDVASVAPDLVIVWSEEEVQTLEGIAPAFMEPDDRNLDDLYASLRLYGKLLGREAEAEAAITRFSERLQAYSQLAPKDISVLKLGAMDDQQFSISTENDPICQILNLVARCDWPDPTGSSDSWSYDASLESVLALDPDVIILNNWSENDDETIRKGLAENSLWNELKAVKNGRVLSTPGYNNPIASSLPAATKFLDTYIPLLYPDIFPEPLSDEQVVEVLAGEASAPTPGEYSITDRTGTTLSFENPPERIVCLYTRCSEVLAALEVEPLALPDWMAGLTGDLAYFPQPNEIVLLRATSDDIGVDLEEVAALNPDLVLGWEELRAAFEGIAPVHVVTDDMDSYEESHEEIRAFGKLLGREQQAEAAIQRFLDRLEAYKQQSPGDRSVMYMWINEEINYRDGQSGTCNLFKEVAACDWPDPTNQDSWSVSTSIEGLLQLDPDVIIISDWQNNFADETAMLAELGQEPLWQELAAFKAERIFRQPPELYNMDGMGPVGAARMLDYFLPRIYPEVFPEALTEAQVQEILGQ